MSRAVYNRLPSNIYKFKRGCWVIIIVIASYVGTLESLNHLLFQWIVAKEVCKLAPLGNQPSWLADYSQPLQQYLSWLLSVTSSSPLIDDLALLYWMANLENKELNPPKSLRIHLASDWYYQSKTWDWYKAKTWEEWHQIQDTNINGNANNYDCIYCRCIVVFIKKTEQA